jgi:DNA-binding transcriptional LysR family regulator
MQDLLDDWWYAHFSQPPMTTIETDAMDTSLKMVQQGLGFTFLTQSCGQDTPGLQAQILTDSKGNPLIRETWLYYRKDYTKLSGLKAFIDFITQAYPLAEDK